MSKWQISLGASVLGAVGVLAAPVAAQSWTSLGPAPITNFGGASGRVAGVACSPTDASKWFIATADGGVWRTTNAGQSWTPLTDHLPTTATGAIAIDPSNEQVIYAGSGEANFANHSRYGRGLYKSVDGGDTWTVLAAGTFSGRCFSRILVHPAQPSVVFASITGAGGGPERFAAKRHPDRAGPRGVFKSVDGGVTWTQLGGGLPAIDATDIEFDPADPQVMYAGVGYVYGDAANGIYKSTNGGANWTRLAGGLPVGTAGRVAMAMTAANRNRIYALFAAPVAGIGVGGSASGGGQIFGAYRSDDAGANWTQLGLDGNLGSVQQFYNNLVIANPTNADLVFFAGVQIVRSTDAGATFTGNLPAHHPDFHAAAWDAAGRLVVGNDGGTALSSDLGDSFATTNTDLANMQFYAGLSTHPTDDTIIYGGLQDNGTARRDDPDSRTWTSVFGGDGGWTQLDQSDPARIFLEFQGAGNLFRSTNFGQSFPRATGSISGRHAFLPPFLIDATNPQRMVYATERVWESLDGGSTFTAVSADLTSGSPFAIRAVTMSPTDSRYMYVVTSDNRVLASSDSGRTFALRLADHFGWPRVTREIVVDNTDPLTVYLAGATFGAPHVRRSRDGGVTWQTLSATLPDVPVNSVGVDTRYPTARLYAGGDDGVYQSRNGGQTWSRLGDNFPHAAVVDILVQPVRPSGNGRLIVATQGRGAWAIPLYCIADFNSDGAVNADDLSDFITAYFDAGGPGSDAADFNGDGVINADDLGDYITAYFDGCG